jgi:hypothetical protein
MSKPIQICVTSAPAGGQLNRCEPYVQTVIVVLCSDGRIFRQYSDGATDWVWSEVHGPWSEEGTR